LFVCLFLLVLCRFADFFDHVLSGKSQIKGDLDDDIDLRLTTLPAFDAEALLRGGRGDGENGDGNSEEEFTNAKKTTLPLLGSGEFGAVYLKRNIPLEVNQDLAPQGSAIAVKIARTGGGKRVSLLDDLAAEAVLACPLRNEHVVRLFGVCREVAPETMHTFFGEVGGPPGLALLLEYMSLGSVIDVLDRARREGDPIGWKQRVVWIGHAAKGLEYCSGMGITHR
jgi:Protein tyrosine and serine/threonine kinase